MARLTCLTAVLCVAGIIAAPLSAQERQQITIVKGKIKAYERSDPATVTVITETGDLRAELAPVTYLEEQKLTFNTDEEVTLKGFEEIRDGRKTFVVTEVTTKERPSIRLRREDRTPVWVKTTTIEKTTGGGPQEIRVIKGKIKTYERADPANVTIITESGELQAELAPVTYLEEQKLVFNPNEEITIKGIEQMRDGRRTFVVTEVGTRERQTIRLRRDDLTPVWTKTTTIEKTPGGETHTQEIRVVKGKIKTYERAADPASVTVITETGDLQAELAPVTYLEEQKLTFNPNEDVTLKGFEEIRDGRRVFVVTEVTTKERPAIRLRTEDRKPVWKIKIKKD